MTVSPARQRANDEIGPQTKAGEYALCLTSGALTTVVAGTTTLGHVMAFRNVSTTKLWLRYLAIQFTVTTGFTAGQEVAFAAFVARGYSASHTGGVAADMGGTIPNANKYRTAAPTSVMSTGDCRIGNAGALTAGTHTLDPNPFGTVSGFALTTTPGCIIQRSPGGNIPVGVLFDARDDYSAIVLAANEGIVLENVVLMGAAGVGTLRVWLGFDEGTTT